MLEEGLKTFLYDHFLAVAVFLILCGVLLDAVWMLRALMREYMAGIKAGEERGFQRAVEWLRSDPGALIQPADGDRPYCRCCAYNTDQDDLQEKGKQ